MKTDLPQRNRELMPEEEEEAVKLASIEQRAKDFIAPLRGTKFYLPKVLVTFALKECESERETMEQCCKLQCLRCEAGDVPLMIDGTIQHKVMLNGYAYFYECGAAAIRQEMEKL